MGKTFSEIRGKYEDVEAGNRESRSNRGGDDLPDGIEIEPVDPSAKSIDGGLPRGSSNPFGRYRLLILPEDEGFDSSLVILLDGPPSLCLVTHSPSGDLSRLSPGDRVIPMRPGHPGRPLGPALHMTLASTTVAKDLVSDSAVSLIGG
jgi:hypothetical protein